MARIIAKAIELYEKTHGLGVFICELEAPVAYAETVILRYVSRQAGTDTRQSSLNSLSPDHR